MSTVDNSNSADSGDMDRSPADSTHTAKQVTRARQRHGPKARSRAAGLRRR